MSAEKNKNDEVKRMNWETPYWIMITTCCVIVGISIGIMLDSLIASVILGSIGFIVGLFSPILIDLSLRR